MRSTFHIIPSDLAYGYNHKIVVEALRSGCDVIVHYPGEPADMKATSFTREFELKKAEAAR